MTRLLYDGMLEGATRVNSWWSAVWRTNQTGRDGSTSGAVSPTRNVTTTLTLPSPAATCILGWAFSLRASGPLGDTNSPPIQFVRSGTTELVLVINSSGFIEARRTSAVGTLLGTSSGHTPLSVNSAWHHLQAKVLLATGTGGSVEVVLDKQVVLTVTGAATAGTSGAVTAIGFGAGTGGSGNQDAIYYDDGWVCDAVDATATQGRANNDYLGDLKVATLVPAANGDTTQWTPSTGTNHAALVDEQPPNTTDYVASSTSGQLDLWTLGDLPATATAVHAVHLLTYMAADDAGTISVKPSVKENSTVTEQTAVPITGTTYAQYRSADLNNRPSDGAAWTAADVNSLQAGVKVA